MAVRPPTRHRSCWKRVDLPCFLLLFSSLPVVTPTVTCKRTKNANKAVDFNFFLVFQICFCSLSPPFWICPSLQIVFVSSSFVSDGRWLWVSSSPLFFVVDPAVAKGERRYWGKEQGWLALLLLVRGRYHWGDWKGRRSVEMRGASLISMKVEWVGACEREREIVTEGLWVCLTGWERRGTMVERLFESVHDGWEGGSVEMEAVEMWLAADTTKRLMSSSKCRSVEVINNPARPGSNHREVNCINYK